VRIDFVVTNEAQFSAPSSRTGGFPAPDAFGVEKASLPERVPAFIPVAYMSDPATRIRAYRESAEITLREQLERLRQDWRDRFGMFPPAVENFFALIEIRLAAAESAVNRVEVRERKVMLTRHGDFILVAGKFPRLVGSKIDQHLPEILAMIKKL
jgi:transcription-repair coupling factor (superfamily II helicase)